MNWLPPVSSVISRWWFSGVRLYLPCPPPASKKLIFKQKIRACHCNKLHGPRVRFAVSAVLFALYVVLEGVILMAWWAMVTIFALREYVVARTHGCLCLAWLRSASGSSLLYLFLCLLKLLIIILNFCLGCGCDRSHIPPAQNGRVAERFQKLWY